ncbi:MAG: alpha-L-arabinofuranosidase C-terminal domain-containing protein [Christensenellaceae bacterium]
MKLSFDEWNVLTQGEKGANDDTLWQVRAARAENRYSVCDALVVGQLLTSLMNKCSRVGIACLAQLVNVLDPVRTEGENSFRQTISSVCHGVKFHAGTVLRQMKSGVPVRHSEVYGDAEHCTVVWLTTKNKRSCACIMSILPIGYTGKI